MRTEEINNKITRRHYEKEKRKISITRQEKKIIQDKALWRPSGCAHLFGRVPC